MPVINPLLSGLFIVSAACTKIQPDLPIGGGDWPPYEIPPFPSETVCYFFVPCFQFPTEPVCGLPKNLCGGAYTFPNSCYLGFYNCEHPSNGKYSFKLIVRSRNKHKSFSFGEYYEYYGE